MSTDDVLMLLDTPIASLSGYGLVEASTGTKEQGGIFLAMMKGAIN